MKGHKGQIESIRIFIEGHRGQFENIKFNYYGSDEIRKLFDTEASLG
jgi:hypothetical protein